MKTIQQVAQDLCQREGGSVQIDIAQMNQALKALCTQQAEEALAAEQNSTLSQSTAMCILENTNRIKNEIKKQRGQNV